MKIPDDKAFLSVRDIVELGYGSDTKVRNDIKNGIIPSVILPPVPGGKNTRALVPRDEFVAMLESRRNNAVER